MTFFGKEERWRSIPAHADVHDDHHDDHALHAHDEHHDDHGPDTNGFFYTDEELAAQPHEHEHHHALDLNHKPHEVPPSMWVPLVVLAALSLVGGWFLSNNHLLENWLYPEGSMLLKLEEHPHGIPLMALSIAAAVLGILAGLAFYLKGLPAKEGWDETKWNPFRKLARDQFGYDRAMVGASVDGGGDLSVALWKGADSGVVDGAVNGAGLSASWFGRAFGRLQNGIVRQYALIMLVGVVGLLGALGYSLSKESKSEAPPPVMAPGGPGAAGPTSAMPLVRP